VRWPTRISCSTAARSFASARPGCSKGSSGPSGCGRRLRLQVDLRGVQELTGGVGRAGRRIAVGLAAATAIVGTAIVASVAHPAGWATAVFGAAAVLLTGPCSVGSASQAKRRANVITYVGQSAEPTDQHETTLGGARPATLAARW
jgi:hypothetical protein